MENYIKKPNEFVVVIKVEEETFKAPKDIFMAAVNTEMQYASIDMIEYLKHEWELRNVIKTEETP